MHPEPSPVRPARSLRWRRVLAIGAGVALVPALYAAASAATGGGGSDRPAASVRAAAGADDPGTELEHEHGVVVQKRHGGAPTPSVPEATTPTTPTTPTSPTTPEATVPTTPEREVEHAVPEPGDDNGVDVVNGVGDGASRGPANGDRSTPALSGNQTFSSAGGSITVTVANGAVSLASSSPAPGFTAEVHDNGPSRVEVRFFSGGQEWRIRAELGSSGLTSEITQHG